MYYISRRPITLTEILLWMCLKLNGYFRFSVNLETGAERQHTPHESRSDREISEFTISVISYYYHQDFFFVV